MAQIEYTKLETHIALDRASFLWKAFVTVFYKMHIVRKVF